MIDLARLADHAARRGQAGVLEHLACYFKAPMGDVEHDRQHERIVRYVERSTR